MGRLEKCREGIPKLLRNLDGHSSIRFSIETDSMISILELPELDHANVRVAPNSSILMLELSTLELEDRNHRVVANRASNARVIPTSGAIRSVSSRIA